MPGISNAAREEARRLNAEGFKKCSRCRTVLALSDFPRNGGRPGGRDSSCGPCVKSRREARKAALRRQWADADPYADPSPKTCLGCGAVKPRADYGRATHETEGLQRRCRSCQGSSVAAARNRNRARWGDSEADPYSDPTLKKCPTCKIGLPRSAFSTAPSAPDGLAYSCGSCKSGRMARWRDTTREKWSKADPYADPTLKKCPACLLALPRADFSPSSTAPDGLRSYCRPCASDRTQNRQAHMRDQWVADIDRSAILRETDGRCFYCGMELTPGWHADHVHALALNGSHEPNNIVASCPADNRAKGAKAWPWVGFDPEGLNDAAPDAPFGYMIVYVLGVPYLGTVRLSAAEADAVEAAEVVPDAEEEPEAPAPASPMAL